MTQRAFHVVGRVQGVGFRAFAVRSARALGLVGGVRNEPDGSLTALAAGEEAALGEFRRALERGPAASRVDAVEERADFPEFTSFDAAF